VAVAFTDRRQPVCAAWRPALSAVVDELVRQGERRIWRVLEQLTVVEVELDPRVLANMNTPSDLND
jgi:molybdopterin-guanine dinucleotide biosynthesis protein A